METKKCTKCGEIKSFDEFYKSSRNKDGCRAECKVCEKKRNSVKEHQYKETRKKYRSGETYKNIKRDYYKKNKTKILTENAQWRQTFKGRLMSYKRAAKARDIEWLLSEEEFKSFWGLPCSYCGSEINTIGIDRIDNDKGYIIQNCTPCCNVCNRMKMDLSKDEFLSKIEQIITFLKQN